MRLLDELIPPKSRDLYAAPAHVLRRSIADHGRIEAEIDEALKDYEHFEWGGPKTAEETEDTW